MPPKLDKHPEAYNMNKRCAETDRGVHPHDSKHLILTRYFIIQLSLGEGANKQIFRFNLSTSIRIALLPSLGRKHPPKMCVYKTHTSISLFQ